jgi:hypothetical protein
MEGSVRTQRSLDDFGLGYYPLKFREQFSSFIYCFFPISSGGSPTGLQHT